jgi:hypothetical protein
MSRHSKTLHGDDVDVVVAARTLSPEDSGKTFFLDLAAGFNVNLPPPEAGLQYEFIVKTAPTGAGYTVTATGNIVKGHVLTVDVNSATDPDFDTTAVDVLTFVVNKAVAGDRAKLICDGATWYMAAACSVFDAITLA